MVERIALTTRLGSTYISLPLGLADEHSQTSHVTAGIKFARLMPSAHVSMEG